MQEIQPNNMVQRRVIYFIIRGMLLFLGCILLWRMIAVISSPENSYFGRTNSDLSAIGNDAEKVLDDHVLVEVYYESMCPDSKYFIVHQLVPAMKKIPEIMDFRLVPYGKANTIENATGIYFTCQHLEQECQGNKIHACGIKYIQERTRQLNFVSCLISNIRNPVSMGRKCADEVNAENWNEIESCSKGKEGSELLKAYGEATHNLNPPVSFIPTIVLNKSQGHQQSILKNLLKEVCSIYTGTKPTPCLA